MQMQTVFLVRGVVWARDYMYLLYKGQCKTWTLDRGLDCGLDCPGTAEAKVLGRNQDTEQWLWL